MADSAPSLIERAAARLRQPATSDTGPRSRAETAPFAPRQHPAAEPTQPAEPPAPSIRAGAASHAGTVTISPVSLAANGVILPSDNSSRTVQEFRSLKREVFGNIRHPNGAKNRIVLITSAKAGEGKSYSATNLALAFAYEKDTRVLLIDADAYRHSVLDYLGVSASKGWLDVISDTATLGSVLLRTNLPNLDLLPAGEERSGIPELMSSGRMTTLFQKLQDADPSRILIIDSVPCLTSTEPGILSELAGQTLLIVAANDTARYDIEASLRVLKASASVNLVLNKTHPLLTEQFKNYSSIYPIKEG